MTPGMCRVRHQSSTIIWFATVTTTIKVLTILPFSPADRKEVLEAQNLIDTIQNRHLHLTNNRSKNNITTELVITRRLSTVQEAEVFYKMLALQ